MQRSASLAVLAAAMSGCQPSGAAPRAVSPTDVELCLVAVGKPLSRDDHAEPFLTEAERGAFDDCLRQRRAA
jgi:hypothetical protein